MQVICLEEDAFYNLIEQVVARLKKEHLEANSISSPMKLSFTQA